MASDHHMYRVVLEWATNWTSSGNEMFRIYADRATASHMWWVSSWNVAIVTEELSIKF